MATTSAGSTPAHTATIYHNQRCSTSRKVLALIEEAGITPTVVKYLETPPSRDGLRKLLDDAGLKPSEAIRRKEAIYKDLGLADASEDELLDAMVENPILIERPLVVTDRGTVLARPVEKVTTIL
ncbi:arsenate reductase (glutaredoxin) [Rhodococcus sp. NPDC058505]|uniref:arsenate reductase (glutaredoxin) n=1 Tax=unclassified Rhodococcus (in: high G+C Gram-positive bacteria) TaxID=192944 RepID=UPI003661937D